jgi:hypothetical protein
MWLRFTLIFFLLFSSVASAKLRPKTPSDVYAYAMLVKQEVDFLRRQAGIDEGFPSMEVEPDKQPRHVIQKALEILSKINRYRIINNLGEITIPPYPPREITPQDVYEIVRRLDGEMRVLIHDKKFLDSLELKSHGTKRSSDVYALLWSISLGFDSILGVRGYTPSDVYALARRL